MSTYVLIHGAYHGGWCWDKVATLLEKEGHTVVAPDLPGSGKDNTPIPEITLQAYADRVCEVVKAQLKPVTTGNAITGPIMKIFMRNYGLNMHVVRIG